VGGLLNLELLGTLSGTLRVKDLWPDRLGSFPQGLIVVGNKLYFTANNETNGVELWVINP
jgi:hypothetical protein